MWDGGATVELRVGDAPLSLELSCFAVEEGNARVGVASEDGR